MRCTYCGSIFHTLALCPKTFAGSSARRHLHCSCCGGTDHSVQACPKTFHGNAQRTWHPEQVADQFVLDKGK